MLQFREADLAGNGLYKCSAVNHSSWDRQEWIKYNWIIGVWLETRDKNKNIWNDCRKSLRCRLGIRSAMLIDPSAPNFMSLRPHHQFQVVNWQVKSFRNLFHTYREKKRKLLYIQIAITVWMFLSLQTLHSFQPTGDLGRKHSIWRGRPSALLEGFKFKPFKKAAGVLVFRIWGFPPFFPLWVLVFITP